ncbi:MAG: hypothetical protein KDJ52_35590 [Anaerolineae bacterium]|nr:hypothetical protein [Anaerolineae bacterium]
MVRDRLTSLLTRTGRPSRPFCPVGRIPPTSDERHGAKGISQVRGGLPTPTPRFSEALPGAPAPTPRLPGAVAGAAAARPACRTPCLALRQSILHAGCFAAACTASAH